MTVSSYPVSASTAARAAVRSAGEAVGTPRVVSRPTRPAPPSSTLRLTRRGRVVVVMFVLLVAFAVFLLRSMPASSTDVAHHTRTQTVVITPGETVWDVARRVEPNADPRDVVATIVSMNHLSDAGNVQVGQPLTVPAP